MMFWVEIEVKMRREEHLGLPTIQFKEVYASESLGNDGVGWGLWLVTGTARMTMHRSKNLRVDCQR